MDAKCTSMPPSFLQRLILSSLIYACVYVHAPVGEKLYIYCCQGFEVVLTTSLP